ncbi:MAG: hypothetical protein FJ077_14980 [Cyanobacteria bacterium K_DeepCast_35m_m2_023]|nr:hypothetical protein [Cyanobacteria bacterium K_DeepCast_35m_m2_023]
MAVTLLLAGCANWWQHQQKTREQHLERERCLQRRTLISQRLVPIEADQRALAQIRAERYVPTPRPLPPDPALASRYSQLDQQLDQERYLDRLGAWRWRERQRRQRWQQTQNERATRVQRQRRRHLALLAAVDPQLVSADAIHASRVAQLSRCH